jgi:hypothetical protein
MDYDGACGLRTYHIFSQVFFLVALESFQILEYSTASILDIFFGDFQSLFKLRSLLAYYNNYSQG